MRINPPQVPDRGRPAIAREARVAFPRRLGRRVPSFMTALGFARTLLPIPARMARATGTAGWPRGNAEPDRDAQAPSVGMPPRAPGRWLVGPERN